MGTAAGNDENFTDMVWTLHAKGKEGRGLRGLSVVSDGGTIAYDVSLGYEMRPRDDLNIQVVSDFKRAANKLAPKWNPLGGDVSVAALRPDSMQHGLGLDYKSKLGELKAKVLS